MESGKLFEYMLGSDDENETYPIEDGLIDYTSSTVPMYFSDNDDTIIEESDDEYDDDE